jgi:hypothetical protein
VIYMYNNHSGVEHEKVIIYIRFFLVEPKFVKQGKENKSLGRTKAGLVFFLAMLC